MFARHRVFVSLSPRLDRGVCVRVCARVRGSVLHIPWQKLWAFRAAPEDTCRHLLPALPRRAGAQATHRRGGAPSSRAWQSQPWPARRFLWELLCHRTPQQPRGPRAGGTQSVLPHRSSPERPARYGPEQRTLDVVLCPPRARARVPVSPRPPGVTLPPRLRWGQAARPSPGR